MSIKTFLEENKNNYFSKHFSFKDFIDFYKQGKFSGEDITVLKYSENYYIIQFYNLSKSTIVISNSSNSITEEQIFFIESIINSDNLIEPRKKDISFIKFLREELNLRWKSFIFFILFFTILSFLVNSGLLDLSKKIIEIFISILGVYFSIMIVFLTGASFNYSHELYTNGKLSYYWNTDKNLAKLTFYTILYLIFILILIYLFGNKGFYFSGLRNFGFIFVGFSFYLTYLNFINLIDFYIDKISYLNMGKYKDEFFEYNFNSKINN